MSPHTLFEACVASVAEAVEAERAGADRLELCDWRVEGGATPAPDLVARVVASVRIPVRVLIRPRGGDFVYAEDEIRAMVAEIEAAKRTGAAGVVSGALRRDRSVDEEATARLVAAARPLPFTFHRAFDETADADAALEAVIGLGADRVLTSGQGTTAEAGIATLRRLVERSAGRIVVLAGGGVRGHNVGRIVAESGVREVHARADYFGITSALRIADSG
jgi:copper homeostasis protein